MEIIEAQPKHFPEIVEMIRKVWMTTYRHIVIEQQVVFMQNELNQLDLFLQLKEQGHIFHIAIVENKIVGFVSFYKNHEGVKIPKLYVDESIQKRGVGRKLLQSVEQFVRNNQLKCIELNVNRYNKALYFYRRYGFYILKSVDIPLGEFWLNDYVLRLDL